MILIAPSPGTGTGTVVNARYLTRIVFFSFFFLSEMSNGKWQMHPLGRGSFSGMIKHLNFLSSSAFFILFSLTNIKTKTIFGTKLYETLPCNVESVGKKKGHKWSFFGGVCLVRSLFNGNGKGNGNRTDMYSYSRTQKKFNSWRLFFLTVASQPLPLNLKGNDRRCNANMHARTT